MRATSNKVCTQLGSENAPVAKWANVKYAMTANVVTIMTANTSVCHAIFFVWFLSIR